MGYVTEANKTLHIKVVLTMLDLLKVEAVTQTPRVANEMWKVGAAMAVAQMGSLRGPEVFMLDLAGIHAHISKGKNGTWPEGNPLEVGQCLLSAPHVYLALIGEFKGETGVREHLVALASESKSGIQLRWWLEKLIEVREMEGHTSGPAFAKPDGTLARISDYDEMLHYLLGQLQADKRCDLVSREEDIKKDYSFFRSFRKSAEGRARAAGLDADIQNAMNRWKKIERAKGRRPRFDMADHYTATAARDMMPVTWRYAYAQ